MTDLVTFTAVQKYNNTRMETFSVIYVFIYVASLVDAFNKRSQN